VGAEALSDEDFAARMAGLGPLGARPRLAVAVSGGADSMALALLAHPWATARGGSVVAVTVDHGLRPEAAQEAEQVGRWLAARGIEHVTLRWQGAKPTADIQAAARTARYDLLGEFCAQRGILSLLTAHHQEDQAETLLLRLGRGSGLLGLAAMAPVKTMPWGLILRPLLDIPSARLRATLAARGQDWTQDPSNADAAYARVRIRHLAPLLAAEGLSAERLAGTARRLAQAKDAIEHMVAQAMAERVRLFPAGYAEVAGDFPAGLGAEVGQRLLARLLMVVGGSPYGPRFERLERLYQALSTPGDGAWTLGGCKLRRQAGTLLITREAARMQPPLPLLPGQEALWDNRFRLRLPPHARCGLWVGGLGAHGWRKLVALHPAVAGFGVPAAARATIAVLYHEDAIFAAPVLGYNPNAVEWMAFAPPVAVTPAPPPCLGAKMHYL
jgi:tRNA(Ile)-lysidine synthase